MVLPPTAVKPGTRKRKATGGAAPAKQPKIRKPLAPATVAIAAAAAAAASGEGHLHPRPKLQPMKAPMLMPPPSLVSVAEQAAAAPVGPLDGEHEAGADKPIPETATMGAAAAAMEDPEGEGYALEDEASWALLPPRPMPLHCVTLPICLGTPNMQGDEEEYEEEEDDDEEEEGDEEEDAAAWEANPEAGPEAAAGPEHVPPPPVSWEDALRAMVQKVEDTNGLPEEEEHAEPPARQDPPVAAPPAAGQPDSDAC